MGHNQQFKALLRALISRQILFIALLLPSSLSFAEVVSKTSLEFYTKRCSESKDLLKAFIADRGLESQGWLVSELRVPEYHRAKYQKPSFINLTYWGRPAIDKSHPPLVFLHGGVASGFSSWKLLQRDRTKKLLAEYPGAIYGIDQRNEGCSRYLPSNLHPNEYQHLRITSVLKDLEIFRENVLGRAKIRIFGQSRGAFLGYHYLNRYPDAIDSMYLHGFAIQPKDEGQQYARNRALAYLEAWRDFFAKYPDVEEKLNRIKGQIAKKQCWMGLDQMRICGPEAVGVFGFSLAKPSRHKSIYDAINEMIDPKTGEALPQKIDETIAEKWKNNIFGHFNYILGVNGRDMAGLGFNGINQYLCDNNRPACSEAPFSEIRFTYYAIQKQYWNEKAKKMQALSDKVLAENDEYRSVSFRHIKENLRINKNLKLATFTGTKDPIAPTSNYDFMNKSWGSLPNYSYEELVSGHESWDAPEIMSAIMTK